jgi:hypothetical protein
MEKLKIVLLTFVALAVLAGTTNAAFIYTDAAGGASGNTVRASDANPTDWYETGTNIDGRWRLRTGYANNDSYALGSPGNDIFEASGTYGGEDCVPIITTVSGLTSGETYGVWVVYWSSHDDANRQNWAVQAGLSLTSMTLFDRLGDTGATAGTPTGKVEGDRDELLGFLGTAMADGNGQIQVYIDDKPGSSYVDRTWYDGILVPEPATWIMLVLGAMGMAFYARRK